MDAARKYVEKNQLDKAVKEYLRIVQEDPKDVRVWLKIGDLYAKKGSKQDATETYLKVARFYQDQGFYLKAVAVYKQILKLDPRLVDVNLKLAELYRQLGLLSDAMQHFEQVAGHFHREGNTKDALATVRQLVDLDPENIATRIKLAELYSKEGLTEDACKEFGVASEQLRRQGRQDDFIKVSERLLWHKPENASLNRELAGLYLRRNDPRRALQKLQVCFKADPRDVETLGLLAQAFQGLDQKAKTVSVLKELARIHVENRHRDKAEEVYTKILQFVPNDPDAVQYLGDKAKKVATSRMQSVPQAPTPEPKFNITGELPALAPGGVRMTGAVPLIDEASLDTDFALPDEEDGAGDFSADMASSEGSYRHSSLAGEQHAEEIAKILAETDVYVKYGLHQKAVDHLRRVFALDEENLEARERLKDILVAQGREREALAELIRLAEIAAPVDPERASAHIREALSIDGTNRQAMEIARRFRLDLNTGPVVEIEAPMPSQPHGGHGGHGTGAVTPVDDELDFDGLEFEDGPRGAPAAAVAVARRDSIDDFDPQELIGGLAHGSPTPAPPPNAPVHAPTTTKREHAALRPIPVDTPDDNLEFDLIPSATRQVPPEAVRALAQMAEGEDDLELAMDHHPVTSDDVPVYRGEGRGQWAQPQPQAARAQHEQAASWQSPAGAWGPTQALEDAVAAHLDDDGREIDDEVAAELGAEPIDYDAVEDGDVEELPFDPHEARAFDEGVQLRPPSQGPYTGQSTTDEQQGFGAEQPYVYGDGAAPSTHTSIDHHYGEADGGHDDLAVDESSVINATVDDGYRQAGDSQLVRGDQLNTGAGLEDELEEAEFYLSQNMVQEAAEILHGLRSRYGEHPLIVNKLRDIDGMIGGRMPSAAEVGDDAIEGEEHLAAGDEASGGTDAISLDEIEELDPDDMQDELSDPGDLELGAPRGGKKGPSVLLEKPIDDSDADTHYDLGLAYKEMGLWDEAQKAFEKVARAPGREVQCRLMIGLCQREQSNHSGAVHQFKIGLHAASVTERERQTLYYEIGVTYENMGDTSEALYYLEMVTKRDPGFLDAAARVNRLRAGGARPMPEDSDQHDVL